MKLNVVLFQPQIPQNTGNIIRTCAATGAKLHIVKPMGFQWDDKKLKRAGLDYWQYLDLTFYDSTAEFFEKNKDGEMYFYTTKARKIYSDAKYKDNCYIVFGREDAGIDEEILYNNKDFSVRVPMQNESRSLNLSNTVAIGVYEVLRQWDFPDLLTEGNLRNFDWDK